MREASRAQAQTLLESLIPDINLHLPAISHSTTYRSD
jgi:hypothetical protein